MHIGKKILNDIMPALVADYDIDLTAEEYEAFSNSLNDNHEIFYLDDYKSRQCTSFGLMNKIVEHAGKKKILRFLSGLAGMEPQIQALQPWNRDHVVHPIHTFFTGVYILNRIEFPPNHKTLYSPVLMWRFIAPIHDLGYPIEMAGSIQREFIGIMNGILSEIKPGSARLRQGLWPDNLDTLYHGKSAIDLIQNQLNEWSLEIDVKDYFNWLQKHNKVDHGIIGALAQLKVMDALGRERDAIGPEESSEKRTLPYGRDGSGLDMVSAAASIFIHNIDLNYPHFNHKVNFHIAPMAFLLFLCDTFQEWDRYADRRMVFQGNEFNIEYENQSIFLSVPHQLEAQMYEILNKRLEGIPIFINDRSTVR
ncbi:MAG: hypothetical protein P8Z37_15780 [Acidobacteriota bacterium]